MGRFRLWRNANLTFCFAKLYYHKSGDTELITYYFLLITFQKSRHTQLIGKR